jgi:antitoxin component of MazEF toxin-antitoxin module
MKLSKVNKNGSLSVILPKETIKLNNWEEGQEVYIPISTRNSIVIQQETPLEEYGDKPVSHILEELENTIKSFNQMNKPDDVILRTFLKQQLLITIEKL